MKWMLINCLCGIGGLGLLVAPVQAQRAPAHAELPNWDRRLGAPKGHHLPKPEQAAAAQALQKRIPQLALEWDSLVGGPRVLYARDGFLTGPAGEGRGVGQAVGRRIPAQESHRGIKTFLEEHRGLFGYGGEILDRTRLEREALTPHNQMRTLVWRQERAGLEIYEAVLTATLTREGELVCLATQLVPGQPPAIPGGEALPVPAVSAVDAVVKAAQAVTEWLEVGEVVSSGPPEGLDRRERFRAESLPGEIEVRLVWLPVGGTALTLCWQVELTRRAGGERYRLLLDAGTGEVLIRRCLTVYATPVSYRVYTSDSPAPLSPGWQLPSTDQAPLGDRSMVTLSAWSTNASPVGWIHEGQNETRGNNVEAHLDRDANNVPDLPRPVGNPARVFDYPLDLNQSPLTHGEASVVQFFYWCNWMHDRLYDLGFTEAAGNFQKDNFGRGGVGNDPILADAQDGAGFNNANYTPSPDGVPGRIQMFLFDGPEPDRDGSLDAEIILHEYTHGLTDRLVGGGVGLFALQSVGMAEGWSDFYALVLLSESGDDLHAAYPVGGFSTYQFKGLKENYYFGIRRYPYSTDLTKNPLTFKDIDPTQINAHPGVPRSPLYPYDPKQAAQVHRQGEVWCSALWELRVNLVEKYGFEVGNQLTLQLVTDGLKLSPPNPTFMQARDAILLADRVSTGGQNQFELWQAFAKRGMGVSAAAPSNGTTEGVQEAFDLPDLLDVTPYQVLLFSGPPGGPMVPSCRSLTLTNRSQAILEWAASVEELWLEFSPAGGLLAPGQAVEVAVCLNESVRELPVGSYSDALVISNLTTGLRQSRVVQVQVFGIAAMPFFEDFESGRLQPFWTASGSSFARTQVTTQQGPHEGEFHLTMDSGFDGGYARNELTLALDLEGYTNVVLHYWLRLFQDDLHEPPAGPFQDGADFDGLAISDDGLTWHPVSGFPRVSGVYAELRVNLDEAVERAGLRYGPDFRVRFNHYDNNSIPLDGLALDNISVSGIAPRRFALHVDGALREGLPPGEVQGEVSLPLALPEPVLVRLTSSNPAELQVPDSVVIPSGQLAAVFPVAVVDDQDLDGTQRVLLAASADGFLGGQIEVAVEDNETAVVTLSLPSLAREGQGFLENQARITVSRAPSRDLALTVLSLDRTEVIVPRSVTLPAGVTEASFDLEIVDDTEIDGSQLALVSAGMINWTNAVASITVEDNESTNLFLRVPFLVQEADDVLRDAVRISLSGTYASNLTVTLSSTDPGRVSVTPSVMIPQGQTSVTADLTLTDDERASGAGYVFLTAQAPGFGHGTAALELLDDEAAPQPYGPTPGHRSVQNPTSVDLSWRLGKRDLVRNGGFESGTLHSWTLQSGANGSFVINDGTVDPLGPEPPAAPWEGKFSALSQQIGPGTQTLFQDLVLPQHVDRIWLNWTDRIRNHSEAFAAHHGFRVEIRSLAGEVRAVAFSTAPGHPLLNDWTERSFDLGLFRGQAIRVAFVEEDDLGFLNVQVDQVRVLLEYDQTLLSEVYFGTNPAPGAAEFVGYTTNQYWALDTLDLDQTYYWQVIARGAAERVAGPVWQFRTRGQGGVDHFAWDPVPEDQFWRQPFPVTLTACDDLGNVVSNYSGAVQLSASRAQAAPPVQLLVFSGFADSSIQYRRTLAAIYSHFTNVVATNINLTDASILRSQLSGKDVFLVMEQQYSPGGQMNTLSQEWAPVLQEFVGRGGVVVVCSYKKDEHLLLKNSGLLAIDKVRWDTQGTLTVGASNALTHGLPEAFQAYNLAQYEPPVDGVVLLSSVTTNATAVSRQVGDGLVVLIGTDYDTNRTAMDRLLANAVRWAHPDDSGPVALSPNRSSYFVNGRWQGLVEVRETGRDIRLRALSGEGAQGVSNPFQVTATNDLSLTAVEPTAVVRVGEPLTFRFQVANAGPSAAEAVLFTNALPAAFAFLGAEASQGDCWHTGGRVECALGTLAAGAGAEVTLTVRPVQAGLITNVVDVRGAGSEEYVANNQVSTLSRVEFASLAVGKVTVTEGNNGGVMAAVPVSLDPPNALQVRVDFATSDSTAKAGLDYEATTGTLVFDAGTTNQNILIPILSDTLNEASEAFLVHLSHPFQGIIFRNQGSCQILDDDPMPDLTIGDAEVVEGQEETRTDAVFELLLSAPSGRELAVAYTTQDETTTAGKDYLALAGMIAFPAGSVRQELRVPVFGDDTLESNETFLVTLQAPTGAQLLDGEGRGTILDDDATRLDYFSWNEVESPQFIHTPFPVTLSARDSQGRLFTGFTGPVRVTGFMEPRPIELGAGTQLWDFPMGASFHDQRVQSIYTAEELGGPSRITGLALQVAVLPGQRLQGWTLRMQHTSQPSYVDPTWKQDGWTTVYARDEAITEPGWFAFQFSSPFEYNGTDHLLVDFSFNNSSFSDDGYCYSTPTLQPRSLHFRTDSGFGDPLQWQGGLNPAPQVSLRVPTIRLETEVPVRVAPQILSNFVAGVWTGQLTVQDTAPLLSLRAMDAAGHFGVANEFTAAAIDDLAVTVAVDPVPVLFDATVTYTLQVTNTGPADSTGVVVSNWLAPSLTFLAASASQGQCQAQGADGLVVCQLGDMSAQAEALITIQATSRSLGLVTNRVAVARSEPEFFLDNNQVTTISPAQPPFVFIDDVTVVETDVVYTQAVFRVRLSNPTDRLVSVPFATSNITAVSQQDYTPTSGLLLFPPGTTETNVAVPVLGDFRDELEETFAVDLSSPTNAVLEISRGIGTIIDNDPEPQLLVRDVTVVEGNGGTSALAYRLSLSQASGKVIQVAYTSTNGTATVGTDYEPGKGIVFFPPAVTNRTVYFVIYGDLEVEPDETFFLQFTNPVNAVLAADRATVTIANDDGLPGVVDHFEWSPLAARQFVGQPFQVEVQAKDAAGLLVTNFHGLVQFSGRVGDLDRIVGGEDQDWEYPFATGYHDARTQVIYRADELGGASRIVGLELDLSFTPGQTMNRFTIRLQHTSLDRFFSSRWESNGWTTLYQGNVPVPNPGWTAFHFSTPFEYNGRDNLLVDYSFDNAYFTTDGTVKAAALNVNRSVVYRADSTYGSPLDWAGTTPAGILSRLLPKTRFLLGTDIPIHPSYVIPFEGGRWAGPVQIQAPASDMYLLAYDASQNLGYSGLFDALGPNTDTDGDGMADAWELAYFGSLDHPDGHPDDDPDGDDVSNRLESLAGTNPLDPASVFLITNVSFSETGVQIQFHTVAGSVYQVERTAALTSHDWVPVSGSIAGTGAQLNWIDSHPLAGPAFYRVKLLGR